MSLSVTAIYDALRAGPHRAAQILVAQFDSIAASLASLDSRQDATEAATATGTIPIPVHAFRIVDAGGDVGNIAAIGGVLASNSDPILSGGADGGQQIEWVADSVFPIAACVVLPPDFDGSEDVTIDLWVSSGTTDAADIGVGTSWDGGALVADAAVDTETKSATMHKLTVTVGAADVPNAARLLTVILTPPAHSTDSIVLYGAAVNHAR